MEVVIDKFGRILIPKKVRRQLGIKPGQKLELVADEKNKTIDLVPKDEAKAELKLTDSGIPVFHFNPTQLVDFDVVDLIQKNREERDAKLLGL